MAERYAVASGNWSDVATWDGGVSLPGASDDVYSNNFTVEIDQDVTVQNIKNVAGSTAVAGGSFNCNDSVTITCDLESGSVTSLVISGGAVDIIGNITGGSGSSAYGVTASGGTNSITGNCAGGSGSSAAGCRVTGGTMVITGNCTGGSAANAYGLHANSASAVITVTGNCTGGSAANAYGVCVDVNTTVGITGNVTGGTHSTARGVFITTNGTLNLDGMSTGGTASGVYATAGAANITGNVSGGTETSSFGYFGTASAVGVINGDVTGGSGASAYGSYTNGATLTINGSTSGGSGSSSFGCRCDSSGTLNQNGSVTGGTGTSSYGIVGLSCTINLNGRVSEGSGATGMYATSSSVYVNTEFANLGYPAEADVNTGISYADGLRTGSIDLPAESDVREATTYASSAYTGTLEVPDASEVLYTATFDDGTSGTAGLPDTEIRKRVARYLGYDQDSSIWSSDETSQIDDAIRDGIRMVFYSSEVPHEWSLLRRSVTLSVSDSATWYSLPAGFNRLVGQVTVVGDQPLSFSSETQLRQRQTNGTDTGLPRYVSLRVTASGSYEAGFYPLPSSAVNVELWYISKEVILTPIGGESMFELIVSASILAAHRSMNIEKVEERKPLLEDFIAQLRRAVEADKKLIGMESHE